MMTDDLQIVTNEDYREPNGKTSGEITPISQIVRNTLDRIESASKVNSGMTGLSTGFIDLDLKTSGFQNADFILIASRPSMGKTAFGLNLAQHLAIHEKKCVAIFSLAVSQVQLVSRLIAMESRVDAVNIRSGKLSDMDWVRVIESAEAIGSSKLIIDDTPRLTVRELREKCIQFKNEQDLKIVIIDYLQLMSLGDRKSKTSKPDELTEISRSLKSLARELDIPVIALSQLSRIVDKRVNHRPKLSDLSAFGAVDQYADVVMFIYRDDYYVSVGRI